jgi:hypothetical protein
MSRFILCPANEPVKKVSFFKSASSAGSKKRKLFSVVESFYDPWRDTKVLDKNGDDINPLLRLTLSTSASNTVTSIQIFFIFSSI